MHYGFIKTAAVTPDIRVADCEFNTAKIIDCINTAVSKGVKLIAFPELCVTGYTCSDLFLQNRLIDSAFDSVKRIATSSRGLDIVIVVGAPVLTDGKLYNCGIVISDGDILGIVPKSHLPNYGEFYERRHFEPAPDENKMIIVDGEEYLFGKKIIFTCAAIPEFSFAIEICEDLWVPNAPSVSHCCAGAKIILNLSASDETIAKDSYRRMLVSSQSGRLICGYVYCSAGEGESTTDVVFGGQNIICENGAVLCESKLFENSMIITEIDVNKLSNERRKLTTFPPFSSSGYDEVFFDVSVSDTELTRFISPQPFVPSSDDERDERCEAIISIQSMGLKKRLAHTGAKTAVIGVSGGLDSTLALLVAVRAMDKLGRSRKDIISVTMPCFGTTKRTKSNAQILSEKLGVTFLSIDITKAVNQHFIDIDHDPNKMNVVYENSQARERTQVLMDIANKENGLVIGTGDLSELALGWATYNGDHISMYAVNTGVPKTLIRHIVRYFADTAEDAQLKASLYDILDTPVSPELLPPSDEQISQVTEDIVGPYELHDFFLYYAIRWGFKPKKVYHLACYAFLSLYEKDVIMKWLKIFYSRFFAQQFKRSCLPDGPKVGTVTLSPRGDWRMPSDACAKLWLDELDDIEI